MIPSRLFFAAALLVLSGCAEPADKLAETVKAKLDENPALLADQLHVNSEGGTVYVHGLVSTDLEYRLVEQIGRGVPGVKRFINATSVDNARY